MTLLSITVWSGWRTGRCLRHEFGFRAGFPPEVPPHCHCLRPLSYREELQRQGHKRGSQGRAESSGRGRRQRMAKSLRSHGLSLHQIVQPCRGGIRRLGRAVKSGERALQHASLAAREAGRKSDMTTFSQRTGCSLSRLLSRRSWPMPTLHSYGQRGNADDYERDHRSL